MQIQPISSPAPAAQSNLNPGREAAAVDFQSFLQLLTAQLRNQDPLSPLDSTQFVAQLASFSTVEQLVSANARLDTLAENFAGGGIGDFAAWIGRTAEVEGAPAYFDGAPVPVSVQPRAGASQIELVVRTTSGAEVGRSQFPATGGAGVWDGTGGQAGSSYVFEAVYHFADGTIETGPAATFSSIEALRNEQGGILAALASGALVRPDQIRSLSR
jgi:flagellar basal-body rod modification protein FlgD